jgi:hypothetical protein
MAVATGMSFSLGAGGHADLKELLDPKGELAPMTPKYAASAKDVPRVRRVKALGGARVHNIFERLREVSTKQKLLVGSNFNPAHLSRALQGFLEGHLEGKPEEELQKHEPALIAEIVALLKSYHG